MDAFPAILEEIIEEWPDDSGAQKALLKLPFLLEYRYIIWKKEEESWIAFILCLVRAKAKRPEYILPHHSGRLTQLECKQNSRSHIEEEETKYTRRVKTRRI